MTRWTQSDRLKVARLAGTLLREGRPVRAWETLYISPILDERSRALLLALVEAVAQMTADEMLHARMG